MKRLFHALGLLAALTLSAQAAPSSLRIAGSLGAPLFWQNYKRAFVSPGGRVIDNANGDVSHSEGQGYGLLLAVAADDREAFAKIWAWTRAQLMLRDDGLAAWRWEPDATPHVGDRNNASDGDILIAWALAEAGEAWSDAAYKTAALQMVRAIARNDVADSAFGPMLKPGTMGYGPGARPDGPVVNLSYFVFPALARFDALFSEGPFGAVLQAGLKLADHARFGGRRLPSDWISLAGPVPTPAQGFPPVFGYDAIRIPLYLVLAGLGTAETLAPYADLFADAAATPMRLDVRTGAPVDALGDSGYRAIAALTRCALRGAPFPPELEGSEVDRYYPSTLRGLVLIALHQEDARCR